MAALFKMIVAASILLAAQMAGGVHAQTLEEFFKSRPFTIVVGYPPGAAYDMYARLIARRLGHHLPGTPTVVVQNMPGAGSLSAANHLYNVARRDGSDHRHVLARHHHAADHRQHRRAIRHLEVQLDRQPEQRGQPRHYVA
jgi:tripartite-type tricarboxylate transporter receptor subunit TctC